MAKNLNDLTLTQLIELKSAADLISEEYAKELTTYATMNQDYTFSKLSWEDTEKYKKRIASQQLSENIKKHIEKIIEEYYG